MNAILILGLLIFLAGLLIGRHLTSGESRARIATLEGQIAARSPGGTAKPTREEEILLILAELDRPPFTTTLSHAERAALTRSYETMLSGVRIPTRVPDVVTPLARKTPPPVTVGPVLPAPAVTNIRPPDAATKPAPRPPLAERRRRVEVALDPAIMLLYLGGLLVVAAGLIYASYSWATLGPWQKMGLLIAATAAFLLAGITLMRHDRVRQAGETYIAIGCMLVPTNGIAAYTMIEGAQSRPELPLLFAAIATALTHGAFSIKPGGVLYTYSSVISCAIAIGTLPAAFGMHPSWGTPALLLGVALIPAPSGRLGHLRQAFDHVSVVGMGTGLILMIAAFETWMNVDRWLMPATLASLALALLRIDRQRTRYDGSMAGLASIAITGAVGSALWAGRIDDLTAWALCTLAVVTIVTVAIVYGPDTFRRPVLRGMLTLQVTVLSFFPAILFLADDRAWSVTLATMAGFALTALVAASWQARWLLLFPSLHLLVLFFSTLGFIDTSGWLKEDTARFMMLPPVVLATFAWALDRSGRDFSHPVSRLGLPAWVMTVMLAGVTILFGFPGDQFLSGEVYRFALTIGMLALIALVAAWSLDAPLVRYVYGGLGVIAIGTALEPTQLEVLDLVVAFLAGCAAFATPSMPAIAIAMGRRFRPLRPFAVPTPRHELKVIGAVAAFVLALMAVATALYIGNGAAGEPMSLATSGATWPLYLLTFAILAVTGAAIGWRSAPVDDTRIRVLAGWTLGWAFTAVALATRMLTTDLIVWTWVAMAAGIVMVVVVTPAIVQPDIAFFRALVPLARSTGMAIGYVGLAGTLLLATTNRPQHDTGQVAVFVVAGLALIAAARTGRQAPFLYHGLAAIGLAIPFGMRALGNDLQDTSLAFTAFAWLLAIIGMIAARAGAVSWSGPHLVNGAMVSQAVAIGLALPDAMRSADSTRADITSAIAWSSLALLLAIEGTRMLDARRTLLALVSGIAAIMATTAAFDGDRFAMSMNLVIYGWLAVGMLIAAQRWPHPAWPRRHGTETGIGANLVALAIPIVSLTETMRQDADPALVLGLVSMAGMLAVDAYLHQDRVRAILATVFGMAALLYQIDTSQPADIHAYTVPLALYLLALGYLFRRHPLIEQPLMAIGAATLAVPTLLTALDEGTFRWLIIAGIEGFALLFGGMLTRLRVPIAAGILTITVIVLRMSVDAVNALPSWVTLLVTGIVLLVAGTLALTYHDALKERLGSAKRQWAHLG